MPTISTTADAAFLPMSSDVPFCGTAEVRSLIGVPPGYAFLPEEIVLRDPEKWTVTEVKAQLKSQFAAGGCVPGILFGGRAQGCQPDFDAVQGGDTFSLMVSYAGSNPGGEQFVCGAVGRVVRLPSTTPTI
jgi:hypothetical protein